MIMEKQEYERELDLKSLLIYILRHLKVLIGIPMICMVLLGVYKYVKIKSEYDKILDDLKEDKSYFDIVQDAMDGLVDANTLKGNVRLYYNMLQRKKSLDDDIKEREMSLEMSRVVLEGRKSQLESFEQVSLNDINSEDLGIFLYYKNSAESSVISSENEIKNKEYQLEKKKTDLEKTQNNIEILSKQVEEDEKDDKEDINNAVPMLGVIKYALAGLIGSEIMLILVLCIVYAFSGKLRDLTVLKNIYGMKLLGVIPSEEQRNGRFIKKLNTYNIHTKQQAYDTIYVRLVNAICNIGDKNILVTGTADEETIKGLISQLQKIDNTIKYTFCPNTIETPTAVLMFRDADEILLIEHKDKSLLEDIQQEVSYINDVNKMPVGVVVIN